VGVDADGVETSCLEFVENIWPEGRNGQTERMEFAGAREVKKGSIVVHIVHEETKEDTERDRDQ
jgi:hypothetical protein